MGDMSGFASMFSGFSDATSSIVQGAAASNAAGAQESLYNTNAKFAELAADDAIKRGDKMVTQVKQAGKKMVGAQRARLAAQGIEVDSGSAQEIQEETAMVTAEDAMTVKNNAWREAWGFKVEAADAAARGRFARVAGDAAYGSSLLTGGLKAAGGILKGAGEYDWGSATESAPRRTSREPGSRKY